MKKKIRNIVVVLVLLGIVSSAFMYFINAMSRPAVEDGYVFVSDAKKDAQALISDMKNKEYKNLVIKDIRPIVPDTDYVCDVNVIYKGNNNPLTKENIEEKIEWMKAFFGEDIDLKDTRIDSFEGETFQEYLDRFDESEYKKEEDQDFHMFYYIKDDEDKYGQVASHGLWIDTGFEGICPDFYPDTDKIYYAGGSNLDDTYNTLSGKMSVQEAIDDVEKYFNENFPIDMNTPMKYKAFRVVVQKEDNDCYSFLTYIRQSYNGTLFESAYEGNSAYGSNGYADLAKAVLIGKDNINFFNSITLNRKVEESENTYVIISLDTALNNISDSIGENSQYKVKEIELGYSATDDMENNLISAKPVWIIYADNESDTRETRFYVDVRTGEVHARVME